jgi:serine/alanine adding enzyme
MFLDLAPDVDSQWRAFNAKLRNQIRKADESALQFMVAHLELLDGFYAVCARNMRDLRTPIYAKSFSPNILEVLPDSTRSFCCLP